MDYDLALELKEAGFPQAADEKGTLRRGSEYLFPDGFSLTASKKKFDAAVAYAPTLSELIAECGDVVDFTLVRGRDVWYAGGINRDGIEHTPIGTGPTPEIAVAKLYIALNKK